MSEGARRHACVDLPALPLQVLRRDHPEWEGCPVVVVARDEPQAPVTWVSQAAQALGVRVGMRYAGALALSRELRAAPVSPRRIDELRAELVGALHRYTPRVEPDRARVGVFWLDPGGMLSLFGSLERWARAVSAELTARRWSSAVVVGHARLPSWAIARGITAGTTLGDVGASAAPAERVRVLGSPEQERELAARVPLGCLDLPVELADALFVMGVRTLGELLAIPRSELSVRFGRDAARLHAELEGRWDVPFEAAAQDEPIEIEAEVDPPDDDETRLLFCARGALHVLVATLAERRRALAALHVELESERGVGLAPGQVHREVLRPARASRDVAAVTELLRLRFSALAADGRLGSGGLRRIQRIRLRAEPVDPDAAQLALLAEGRSRDPDALARGIARLRAAFGDEAVTVPRLEDSWIPERSFRWEPVERLPPPGRTRRSSAAREGSSPPRDEDAEPSAETPEGLFWSPTLVRRILAPPGPLETSASGGPRTDPPIRRLSGPFRLQSGWWASGTSSGPITRDYFYAERVDGALLWVFRDALHERWYLQGIVD
jgi:protein ImuB